MSKLSPLKPMQVTRKLGFIGPVPGGRYARMVKMETGQIIPVPMHEGRDVSIGLIRAMIREAGITPEEWNQL